MKNKKMLIIGDSNCLPRYNTLENDIVSVEDTYVYHLQKNLENFDIQTMIVGGVTTSELLNFSIPYFLDWEPNFVIIHSGVNDTKSQFINNNKANILYRILSKFSISKKKIKENFVYNRKLINLNSTPKVPVEIFIKQIKKFLYLFKKSKVLWIEIHNDERIDKERPGTSKRLNNYNFMLREVLKDNFVELKDIKDNSNFTSDGFHLNKKGQWLLYEKINKIILNNA
ncbi:MAG: hypothetical protein CMB83_01295 [Flammeovirgaceae bacterium]|nr:hypothetical protein [Flammeovirgaceae bacterium]|tara:strand:+ start:1719 stop:2399 length:681 start_codon:yes stop_codon:yes gene_type:complete